MQKDLYYMEITGKKENCAGPNNKFWGVEGSLVLFCLHDTFSSSTQAFSPTNNIIMDLTAITATLNTLSRDRHTVTQTVTWKAEVLITVPQVFHTPI